MSSIAHRLPHILPRNELAALLGLTYARAVNVDEEVAVERLERALDDTALKEALYAGIEAALREAQGKRTTEDALMDKLSQGLEARRARIRPVAPGPEVGAAVVAISLAAGEGTESMRAPLESERGRALVAAGMKALGSHLVRELLK